MTDSRILKTIAAVTVIVALKAAGASYLTWDQTKSYYDENPVILESVVTRTVTAEPQIIEKEVTISGETICSGLEEIGTLNTAEYYFTHVSKYEDSVEFLGCEVPFSESSFVYSYDGRICAGVDFSEIAVEVDEESRTITVTLPPVMITSFEIDTDSFTLYDESESLINQISVEAMADSISEIELDEREKAVDKGLLETAEENAKVLIENFMDGLYEANSYTVVIQATGLSQGQ